MKTSISEISMKEFIPLFWGDYSGIMPEAGDSDEVIEKVAADMIYNFNRIVDPTSDKMYLLELEEKTRTNSKLLLAKLIQNLYYMGFREKARNFLPEIACSADTPMNEVSACLRSFIASQEYSLMRISERTKNQEQPILGKEGIVDHFDETTAFIMEALHVQLNLHEITAGIYAHLLRRAIQHIKQLQRK